MLKEVGSCLQVKATMEPLEVDVDIFGRSMRSKFVIFESTRPDVIQLFTGLQQMFLMKGEKYNEQIAGYIQSFNSKSQVDAARISEAEAKMLVMLPAQQFEFVSVLERHCDHFKIQDSGVTLKSLINTVDRVKRMDNSVPGIWQSILAPSPEKNTLYVQRAVHVFLKNLAQDQAGNKGTAINLRMRASKLRGNLPENYDMCCLRRWRQQRSRPGNRSCTRKIPPVAAAFLNNCFPAVLSRKLCSSSFKKEYFAAVLSRKHALQQLFQENMLCSSSFKKTCFAAVI